MNKPQTASCTGLILAGGRGRRLGGADKGWLQLEDGPLVNKVIAQFRPQVATLLISANRNTGRYRRLGFPVLADPEQAFGGPLAGILAGLRHMHTEWLITVPVDAPLLPSDYVARMCQTSSSAPLRVAHDGERIQPVYCLVHRDLCAPLEQAMARGTRAPLDWQRERNALEVSFADQPECFANINTTEQLTAFKT